MKKLYKVLLIFIVAVGIFPINKVIADENLDSIVIGSDNKFINNGKDFVLIDIDGMMPGDSIDKALVVKNNSNKSFELKADTEQITVKDNEIYLLDKLDIKLVYDNNEIFNGKASDIDTLKNQYISLGELNKGLEGKLEVFVELDGKSVGNEFQNKLGAFKINFYITENIKNTKNELEDSKGVTPDVKPNSKINISENLPNTGGQNSFYAILLSLVIILIGYKFIKRK